MEYDFPVDIVYLWVDGNDPEWKSKKLQYMPDINDEQICGDCRYFDNDELKYSLRSVEKNADWINTIYIVTDGQIPKWLDTSNKKIKVVFHKDFIPEKYLPLFNSEAIETFLPYIPDLSEHFLYANDDMYIAKPVKKSDFYTEKGLPIVRLKHQVSKRSFKNSLYNRTIYNMQKLIKETFKKNIPFAPHHNIDSYRKSDFIKCINIFKDKYEMTGKCKFRTEGCIQRVLVSYYAICTGNATIKMYSRVDSHLILKRIVDNLRRKYSAYSIVLTANNINIRMQFDMYNPKLFCINDSEETSDTDRQRVKEFLTQLFPQKSSFEL